MHVFTGRASSCNDTVGVVSPFQRA